MTLNPFTEGDRRELRHAQACTPGTLGVSCQMSCRCWCHGIKNRPDGSPRADIGYDTIDPRDGGHNDR